MDIPMDSLRMDTWRDGDTSPVPAPRDVHEPGSPAGSLPGNPSGHPSSKPSSKPSSNPSNKPLVTGR